MTSYLYTHKSSKDLSPLFQIPTQPNRMHQWCCDHTGNIVMDITMFYVICLVINVTLLCIYYEMCCFTFLLWSLINKVIWFARNQLDLLYYQVYIQKLSGVVSRILNPTSFGSKLNVYAIMGNNNLFMLCIICLVLYYIRQIYFTHPHNFPLMHTK